MSRSYKYRPGGGCCKAKTQKRWKKAEHRAERSAVKQSLITGQNIPHPKEYGNEWSSPRDGKLWWDKPIESDWVKDWKKWMRK